MVQKARINNMKEICTEIIWYGGKRNGKWIIPVVLDFDFTVTCKSSWLDGTFTENEGCFATLKKWTEEYNVMYVLDTCVAVNTSSLQLIIW